MKLLIWFAILANGAALAYEPPPEEAQRIHAALEKWREIAANPGSIPEQDRISKLGYGVFKTGQSQIYVVGDREAVHRELQQALVAIPGHAEFYGNKIRRDRELRKAGRDEEVEGSPLWDFETLAQLPSPETVRVLGSFLDDEIDRIPDEVFRNNPDAHVAPIGANNLLAARALTRLGIANPPLHMKPEDMFYDDIEPWRLWFAHLRAGNRTFRFEGDPVEYTLSGPVRVAKADPANARPKPAQADEPMPVTKTNEKQMPVVPLILAGLLLGAAAWWATRKRQRSSARG